MFEIHADSVICLRCKAEYRIGIEVSPARFNTDRHKVVVIENPDVNMKTGRKW